MNLQGIIKPELDETLKYNVVRSELQLRLTECKTPLRDGSNPHVF